MNKCRNISINTLFVCVGGEKGNRLCSAVSSPASVAHFTVKFNYEIDIVFSYLLNYSMYNLFALNL